MPKRKLQLTTKEAKARRRQEIRKGYGTAEKRRRNLTNAEMTSIALSCDLKADLDLIEKSKLIQCSKLGGKYTVM